MNRRLWVFLGFVMTTLGIVGAILPELDRVERERAKLKKPENLTAWDLTRRGDSYFYDSEKADRKENLNQAMAAYERAIEIDPRFAAAYAGISRICASRVHTGISDAPEEDREKGLEFARHRWVWT